VRRRDVVEGVLRRWRWEGKKMRWRDRTGTRAFVVERGGIECGGGRRKGKRGREDVHRVDLSRFDIGRV
jgi:hypothetical protein